MSERATEQRGHLLRVITPNELPRRRHQPVDTETLRGAEAILDDVRERGLDAVVEHATRLGDIADGSSPVLSREALEQEAATLAEDDRALLKRVVGRVRRFAEAQRAALVDVEIDVPGGRAGHRVTPVRAAGCYAPGGRFPLPSSVIMTVATARAAGVETVWVASPRPTAITMAAAAIASADAMLAVGGAQAIGAFAFGTTPVPRCDVIVGPGNRWVTAAKKLVAGETGIDFLAGPSELVIVADATARPDVIAADLLAQAEHDTDALPILVATDADLAAAVDAELAAQLADLPTADTARAALANGFAVLAPDLATACRITNELAPEHLEVQVADVAEARRLLTDFGGVFYGTAAAEVFGDYGAGPNHVLPTGGTARFTGGLSVHHFLTVRTYLDLHDDGGEAYADLARDTARLARLEGLEGHARSAEKRLSGRRSDRR